MNPSLAYAFAIASSVCFSSGSLVFADFSRRLSPVWMNIVKAAVAWLCFGMAVAVFGWTPVGPLVTAALFVSGILGLAIGDIFLLTAYARIGAARSLILFGFQPLFIGVAAHFLFGQELTWQKGLAIIFFVGCLFVFSLERYRRDGHWELWGLLAALIAVLLDNCGLLLSRWAFEQASDLSAFQANLVRCTGALALFFIFGRLKDVHFRRGWKNLAPVSRAVAVGASVLGCFVSLSLYLWAVKIGHLASISALGGAGPIITSGIECAYTRKAPSRYLLVALSLFSVGFSLLTLI